MPQLLVGPDQAPNVCVTPLNPPSAARFKTKLFIHSGRQCLSSPCPFLHIEEDQELMSDETLENCLETLLPR